MLARTAAVVCLAACLCASQVRGSHIPAGMNRTLQDLLKYYNIKPKEMFTGDPVFPRAPLYDRMEMKHLFMSSVLETYEKLIAHMIKQLPTTATATPSAAGAAAAAEGVDVRAALNSILEMVQHLRKQRYRSHGELVKRLQKIGHIQMDNPVVQSKALWELTWVYEQASLLSDEVKMQQRRRRRRRRQARKVKAPPTI